MDLVEYVASLPPIKIVKLYDSPYTCLAILRTLMPIARQYVLRILFLDNSVPEGTDCLNVLYFL